MLQKKKVQRSWMRITAVLAAAALIITSYAFILPAVAMERQTYCGEEHEHTEACYAAPSVKSISEETDIATQSGASGESDSTSQTVTLEEQESTSEPGTSEATESASEPGTSEDTETTSEPGATQDTDTKSEPGTPKETGSTDVPEEDGEVIPEEGTEKEGSSDEAQQKSKAVQESESTDTDEAGDDIQTFSSPVEGEILDEGTLTETLSWRYTEDDAGERTLTIYGTGAMPDYETAAKQPWQQYRDDTDNIIIEDGVTSIGAHAFYNVRPSRIEIGNSVEIIKTYAFAYMTNCNVTVTVPGNVKTIESYGFGHSSGLKGIILEEGVEKIGMNALVSTDISELTLPASLGTIERQLGFPPVSAYYVAEGNSKYYAEDGILFERKDDGTACLVAYPRKRDAVSYTIPENVSELGSTSFRSVENLQDLTIPSTVTVPLPASTFTSSSLVDVVIEDGVKFEGDGYEMFAYCESLRSIRLPEDVSTAFNATFTRNSSLEEITVPKSITSLGNNIFSGTQSLTKMIFNAENCTSITTPFTAQGSDMPQDIELEIGNEVNILTGPVAGGLGFSCIAERASSIIFKGENDQILIGEGALEGAIRPLDGLSGTFYVDSQGILYQLDEEGRTATLVYCSLGNDTVTIPASFSSGGEQYQVTGVGQYAFIEASGLSEITFEDPGAVTEIVARAFANCPTLEKVNGETTEEGAERSFGNANVGYQAFYGTGLDGVDGDGSFATEMDGSQSLEIHYVDDEGNSSSDAMHVTVNSTTAQWQEEGAEKGGYRLLTGDELNVTVSVGNTDASDYHAYRVYFELTDLDGYLSLEPGVTYNFNGIEVACYSTASPNIVYLDFLSQIGHTVTFAVTANYPSPQSGGGGIKIWGESYYYTEGEEQPEDLEPEEYIQAYWTTEPDDFTLTKTSSGTADIPLTGDGEGNTVLSSDLGYTITLQRTAEEVSAYGKDYVRSVDYTDTPDLPDGVNWKQEVLDAVRDNDVRLVGNTLYADDIRLATISSGSSKRVTCTEEGNLQFSWSVSNTTGGSSMTEISTNNITFTIASDALEIDLDSFNGAGDGHEVNNTVDATIHYSYSDDVLKTASAKKTLSAGNGRISLTKTAQDITYFGEEIEYTIRMRNPGAFPYRGTEGYILTDTLDANTYISAEGMQKMFDEEYGKDLTVTITGASLAQWNQVTGVDGTESWQNAANTDLGESVTAQELTIWKADDGSIHVKAAEGSEYTGQTVDETLKAAGYAPIAQAQYTVTWALSGAGEDFVYEAGESRTYMIYATAKDTFLMLTMDWPGSYINETDVTYRNSAAVRNGNGQNVITASSGAVTAHREAYIDKSVYKDGRKLSDSLEAEDGDVLDYVLNFRHYGTGSYTDLPMVDDLYGSQMLLVEKDLNPRLEGRGLETYTDPEDRKVYYILSQGEYTDVVVGTESGENYTAASITVAEAKDEQVSVGDEAHTFSGLHTRIKWYFPQLQEAHSYQLSVSYKAIVDTSAVEDGSYDIGNMVWMNDHTDSRIYAGIWGGGTIIDFDKEILLEGGDGEEEAVRYSAISEGEEVKYRLTLRNKGDADYVLNGTDMVDILPNTYEVFEWNTENVKVEWESTSERTEIEGLGNWSLSDESPGTSSSSGQQYLLWPGDTQIRFHDASEVYIYVTLTFPSNGEAGEAESKQWDKYCAAAEGGTLSNTFTVYNFPANVTHNLREQGEVLLQKGVYGTSYSNTNSRYVESPSRIYYNNRDFSDRQITYYVVLYNLGSSRLYLNEIYDRLPAGFTYKGLLADARMLVEQQIYNPADTVVTNPGTNYGFVDGNVFDRDEISWKSARINASEEEENLKFTISAGNGDDTVRYDEEREMYYLAGGEAIAFGYICDIGLSADTEDYADNVTGMAYEDYLGAGVETAGEDQVRFTGVQNENHNDLNDGSCSIGTAAEAEEYCFTTDSSHDTWLLSDVTVSRGGIRPGVTKTTESYVEASGGQTHEYETAVGPWDTVNWKVRYENGGTQSIVDYTLCDTLPAPYTLTGPVTYTIYGSGGESARTEQLFSVRDHTPESDTVEITTGTGLGEMEIPVNGGEKEVKFSIGSIQYSGFLSFSRSEAGNETVSLRIPSRYLAIPESGYAELQLSGRNLSTSYSNKVYTNRAMIYPIQEFDGTNQGTLIRGEDGRPEGVVNTAPVNVASGYATQSEKRVEETENQDNNATSSNPSDNTITLGNTENQFRYTLSVTNSTDVSMSELILIDSLPAEGDHSPFDPDVPRGSEFQVDFADDLDLTVQIKTEDGETIDLGPGAYTAEYSTKTEFDSEDWDGTDKTDWGAFSKDARSLRITISDPQGITIPASAEVMVKFNAIVHRDEKGEVTATPGAVAWNSFGYHYRLVGVDYSLEAMPLNVGVKVPTAPDLQKKLIDLNGQPYAAEKDEIFQLIVHEGEPLESYYEGAIAAAGRDITVVNLVVEAGETESEIRKMAGFNIWKWENETEGWVMQEELWQWKDGETYTVIENWQDNMPDGYEFDHFEGQADGVRTYTFVYEPSMQETITCVNRYTRWNVELTKTDEDNSETLLPGAVFGLYSPDVEDLMTDEEYDALEVKPEKQVEANDAVWYLTAVSTTGEDGKILWEDLQREQYYLLEIKAPDGYNLRKEGIILDRGSAAGGTLPVTVTNDAGFEIPETGGVGTNLYTTGGLALMAGALMYGYRKRRKEGSTR